MLQPIDSATSCRARFLIASIWSVQKRLFNFEIRCRKKTAIAFRTRHANNSPSDQKLEEFSGISRSSSKINARFWDWPDNCSFPATEKLQDWNSIPHDGNWCLVRPDFEFSCLPEGSTTFRGPPLHSLLREKKHRWQKNAATTIMPTRLT